MESSITEMTSTLPNDNQISQLQGQQYYGVCKRCDAVGCDLRVLDCGCSFHARCLPVSESNPLIDCPGCHGQARSVLLLPLVFAELDDVNAAAELAKHLDGEGNKRIGTKRKQAAVVDRLDPTRESKQDANNELRVGRWTNEETAYCDKLIHFFESGELPIPNGIKLNDFLALMLRSKQARLTKKMRNAKLSTRSYQKMIGYILHEQEAREFSFLETNYFSSIRCSIERAEMRFHMMRQWRDLYSSYCVSTVKQKLNVHSWLHSVEEMDLREAMRKNAVRMARRKVLVGFAFQQDAMNAQDGVFIEPPRPGAIEDNTMPRVQMPLFYDSDTESVGNFSIRSKRMKSTLSKTRPARYFSSPFIGRVVDLLQRLYIPFEHVDTWVPSFVPSMYGEQSPDQCRLCFAGYGTCETNVISPATKESTLLTEEQQFELLSFGEYSQKFSFAIDAGLPGRVYSTGVPLWERGIQNAVNGSFERAGGAVQWGIQTVLGIPVPSPNVGRIVVGFYSRHDRIEDSAVMQRLCTELTKMLPSPKWTLVVEVGQAEEITGEDPEKADLLLLVQQYTPADNDSPMAPLLPGFTSLRLLLVKPIRSARETAVLQHVLEKFRMHKQSNLSRSDIASKTARDFMMISKQESTMLESVTEPLLEAPETDLLAWSCDSVCM